MQTLVALALLLSSSAYANPLQETVGRSETRVKSATFAPAVGRGLQDQALVSRLAHLDYRAVNASPEKPGEYWLTDDRLWVYRRAHRVDGRPWPAAKFALKLSDSVVTGATWDNGLAADLGVRGLWLEPEVLAESLDEERAQHVDLVLADLPDHVWQPLLALEDARFFDHVGVDGVGVARAIWANIRAGGAVEGGSTITQQLVKNRDLSAKRTLSRKASEAVRAVALESKYDKADILETYLDIIYYGHVDGVAVYGLGTASQVFFSKPASQLTLDEAALLAAVVQGPNGLSPIRHPDRAKARRDRALDRMAELGWATERQVNTGKERPIRLSITSPTPNSARHFRAWVKASTDELDGPGVVIETTLDPHLQRQAELAVTEHLARLRQDYPLLQDLPLSAALVSLDGRTGEILAHVGGDPAATHDVFDRVTQAKRQPGSTLKPLVMLEALGDCGLTPATRVADAPLTLDLEPGTWTPENYDHRHRGPVGLRTALVDSINVPMVRTAAHCGLDETADLLRATGLELPENAPPSFVLGSVETSPLDLAEAYTVFAVPGTVSTPFGVSRVEYPKGGRISATHSESRRVASPAASWITRDMMGDVISEGTGRAARLQNTTAHGKTGTTSGKRDAWFAGEANGVVTVVWVGLDSGKVGLTGGRGAAPLWATFMEAVVGSTTAYEVAQPLSVVEHTIRRDAGMRVGAGASGAESEYFRRGVLPPHRRFWRSKDTVIE